MANEAVYKYGTNKVLEASGSSTVANAFTQANDASVTASDHNDFTLLDFTLSGAFSVAPTAGEVINLYARLLDIDGTNDSQVPSANYLATYLGSFLVDAVTSTQYVPLYNVSLPGRSFDCYIENKTSQTLTGNWVLKVTPKTIGPY